MHYPSTMFWKILSKLRKAAFLLLINPATRIILFLTSPLRILRRKRFYAAGPSPRTILISFFGRGLGDCIFFSGVLEGVRKRFPNAHIRVAILVQLEKYLKGNPFVDALVPCPDYSWTEGSSYWRFITSALQIRREGPVDLLIDLCPTLALMPGLWGFLISKRYSIGIADPLKNIFYDHSISINWKKHFFDCMLEGLSSLGIQIEEPTFWIPPDVSLEGLANPEILSMKSIVLAPGGKRNVEAPKDYCWIFEGFPYVIKQLTAEGHRIILTGAEYDREYFNSLEPHPLLINLIGQTSFAQIFTLIKRCAQLVVCNNSASLHIATVLGIPTVSYADPQENIKRWGPYGGNGKHRVLQDQPNRKVTPEEFMAAIREKLEEEPAYKK